MVSGGELPGRIGVATRPGVIMTEETTIDDICFTEETIPACKETVGPGNTWHDSLTGRDPRDARKPISANRRERRAALRSPVRKGAVQSRPKELNRRGGTGAPRLPFLFGLVAELFLSVEPSPIPRLRARSSATHPWSPLEVVR